MQQPPAPPQLPPSTNAAPVKQQFLAVSNPNRLGGPSLLSKLMPSQLMYNPGSTNSAVSSGLGGGTTNGMSSSEPVVVTNSNEYLSALKTADPLLHNIRQLCAEIDQNIEESTNLIYEEDQNQQALMHMQLALKKLNVVNPLFEKYHQKCEARATRRQEKVEQQQDWRMLHKVYNIITFYNLAACYQRRGLFKESQLHIQKSIDSLRQLILYQETLSTSDYQLLLCERHYSMFVLQSCAIKSQLQEHDGALESACEGLSACIRVFARASRLCQEHFENNGNNGVQVRPVSVSAQKKHATQGRESANSDYGGGNVLQTATELHTLKKQKKRHTSAKVKSHTRGTAVILQQQHQHYYTADQSSQDSHLLPKTPQQQPNNLRSLSGGPQSCRSSHSGSLYLKTRELRQRSKVSQLRFHLSQQSSSRNSSEGNVKSVGGESESSLERIHTFNLKAPEQGVVKGGATVSSSPSERKMKNLKSLISMKVAAAEQKRTIPTADSSQQQTILKNQLTKPSLQQPPRQCYIEEQAKPREAFMVDAYKILKSLMKHLKRLLTHLSTTIDPQTSLLSIQTLLQNIHDSLNLEPEELAHHSKKDFHSTFANMGVIEQLRKSDKCKYAGRNMLGVRKLDDWIHTLEIGNIMHLQPLNTQEMILNPTLSRHTSFQKDPMLKNIVHITVALFSIATEMRMMVQFGKKQQCFGGEELMRWSELWHAQSVFIGGYYLPVQCPLVTHIANSYNKHYIVNKRTQNAVAQQNARVVTVKQKPGAAAGRVQSLGQSSGSQGENNFSSDGGSNHNQEPLHQIMSDLYAKPKPIISIASMIQQKQLTQAKRAADPATNQAPVNLSKFPPTYASFATSKQHNFNNLQSESSVSPIRNETNNFAAKRLDISRFMQAPVIGQININMSNDQPQQQQQYTNISINQINSINIFPQASSNNNMMQGFKDTRQRGTRNMTGVIRQNSGGKKAVVILQKRL
ncbi:hypothetical protein FGO68_gene10781 [Halteria grandinella]|uniref:Uncharacterized protein n=1 Tax=Halteria grandinella TaxID=5974 RepID=A0A8J8P1I5_HALGN|nr:hypothetical protein FGO68_gene10781 [Halteria grandinella]